MERFKNMLESINILIDSLVAEKRKIFGEPPCVQSKEIRKLLRNMGKENGIDEEKLFVITYLRSSYITKSHRIKVALYQNEPFVERPLAYGYYNLSPFLQSATEDMIEIKKVLSDNFIRVRSYEIEEVRRRYFERIYDEAKILFIKALEEGESIGSNQVFYGQKMGIIELIGWF